MAENIDRTAELEAELLQGARGLDNNTKNMLERLADEFKAGDLVEIENVMPEAFGWVYTDPSETTEERPDTATRRVNFGAPKSRALEAGEHKIIPGWEAYIALERMWKAWAQRDITQVSYFLTSSQEMESFLAKAYHGKYDPNKAITGNAPAPVAALAPQPVVTQPEQPAAPVAPVNDPALGFGNGNENQGNDAGNDDENEDENENQGNDVQTQTNTTPGGQQNGQQNQ